MVSQPENMVVVALIFVSTLIFGLALLKWGLWPPRQGDTPYCRRCEYNLTGLVSERCPECGEIITEQTTRYGQRRRRPLLIACGLICIALIPAWLLTPLRTIDWYPYKPTSWVIGDLQSKNTPRAQKAWKELAKRLNNDRLSNRQHAKLIDVCLSQQKASMSGSPHEDLMEQLGRYFDQGKLSENQKNLLYRQMVACNFRVRPRAVTGDKVSAYLEASVNNGGVPVRIALCSEAMLIDGQPRETKVRDLMGVEGYGRGTSHIPCPVEVDQPGNHQAQLKLWVRIYDAPRTYSGSSSRSSRWSWSEDRLASWGKPVHQERLALNASFHVLENEPADYIKLRRDPTIDQVVRNNIGLSNMIFRKFGQDWFMTCNQIAGGGRWQPLPTNVACDVYARFRDDQEVLIATAKGYKGKSQIHVDSKPFQYQGKRAKTIDLIFKSNPDLARRTVDMFEIWAGRLVLEDLPIRFQDDDNTAKPTARAAPRAAFEPSSN